LFSIVPSNNTEVSKAATLSQPKDVDGTQFVYTLCKISIPQRPQRPQPSYIPLVNDSSCGGGCNNGAGGCGSVDSTLYDVGVLYSYTLTLHAFFI